MSVSVGSVVSVVSVSAIVGWSVRMSADPICDFPLVVMLCLAEVSSVE